VTVWKRLSARLEPIFLSDTAFVEHAFREILEREPDYGGLQHYLAALREGVGRTDVVLQIARSEEFRRRLAPRPSSLPSLLLQRPERYRRTIDLDNGQSILVFEATGSGDYDWLERAIVENRYYEEPGVWVLDVDFDKRLVAEMMAAFAPARAIEIGCAAGALLECLADLDIAAEGVEISSMAIERATGRVRSRIYQGDLLQLTLPSTYDLAFGLDVFEHLNPNKLDMYLRRLAEITGDDAYVFGNIPAFGADPVFGTVFPFYVDGWAEEAAADRVFSRLHADDLGYPIHGHLTWADAGWWTRRFEAAGFTRDAEIERAFHRKYDGYMTTRSRARRAYFVFGKSASAARRPDILGRIAAPSRLL
jgi:hypothetical protein